MLSSLYGLAVERALTYQETGRIPGIWEENASDVIVHEDGEEDSKKAHSSEDESSVDEDGEKKAFKEKLFAFMKEKGRSLRFPLIFVLPLIGFVLTFKSLLRHIWAPVSIKTPSSC